MSQAWDMWVVGSATILAGIFLLPFVVDESWFQNAGQYEIAAWIILFNSGLMAAAIYMAYKMFPDMEDVKENV